MTDKTNNGRRKVTPNLNDKDLNRPILDPTEVYANFDGAMMSLRATFGMLNTALAMIHSAGEAEMSILKAKYNIERSKMQSDFHREMHIIALTKATASIVSNDKQN